MSPLPGRGPEFFPGVLRSPNQGTQRKVRVEIVGGSTHFSKFPPLPWPKLGTQMNFLLLVGGLRLP